MKWFLSTLGVCFTSVVIASGAEFMAVPDFLDWSDRSEANLARIAQRINAPEFASRFSLKREYRLEPWRETLIARTVQGSTDNSLRQVQKDVNRTILEDWELEFATKFATCYQRGEPLGCAFTTFHAGVPVELYLDSARLASDIQASAKVPRWIPNSVRNIYGLPRAKADAPNHPVAVAVLAEFLNEETVSFLENLEKQGFHVDLVSRKMLERATTTLVSTPSGVHTIHGLGAMEYTAVHTAPGTEPFFDSAP